MSSFLFGSSDLLSSVDKGFLKHILPADGAVYFLGETLDEASSGVDDGTSLASGELQLLVALVQTVLLGSMSDSFEGWAYHEDKIAITEDEKGFVNEIEDSSLSELITGVCSVNDFNIQDILPTLSEFKELVEAVQQRLETYAGTSLLKATITSNAQSALEQLEPYMQLQHAGSEPVVLTIAAAAA